MTKPYDESMVGRALPKAIENALRPLFCEKDGFNMRVYERGLGRFPFRPKSCHKKYLSPVWQCVAQIAHMDKPPLVHHTFVFLYVVGLYQFLQSETFNTVPVTGTKVDPPISDVS